MKWLAGSVLGLALVLGSWASAQEVEREARKLREDIEALSMLRKLELTREQRKKLASIYKQFKALSEEHDKKLLGFLRKKRDLLLSGRASEEELIDLDWKLEQEKLMFRTEVRKLRARAEEVLTPDQRRKLRRAWFRPKRPPRPGRPPRWEHPPERFGPPPPGPSPEEMKERRMRLFWKMMELLGEGK